MASDGIADDTPPTRRADPPGARGGGAGQRRLRCLLATSLLVATLGTWCACSRVPREDGSVLQPDATLPAEFTSLQAVTSNGRVRIEGTFTRDGRTVRFLTARGPRTSRQEFMSGANAYEIDGCFLSQRGRPLISFAGGHDMTIPECGGNAGAELGSDEGADSAEMETAIAAMEELAKLRFRDEYRSEHNSLTGTLGFARNPRALAGAGGGEVIPPASGAR